MAHQITRSELSSFFSLRAFSLVYLHISLLSIQSLLLILTIALSSLATFLQAVFALDGDSCIHPSLDSSSRAYAYYPCRQDRYSLSSLMPDAKWKNTRASKLTQSSLRFSPGRISAAMCHCVSTWMTRF